MSSCHCTQLQPHVMKHSIQAKGGCSNPTQSRPSYCSWNWNASGLLLSFECHGYWGQVEVCIEARVGMRPFLNLCCHSKSEVTWLESRSGWSCSNKHQCLCSLWSYFHMSRSLQITLMLFFNISKFDVFDICYCSTLILAHVLTTHCILSLDPCTFPKRWAKVGWWPHHVHSRCVLYID